MSSDVYKLVTAAEWRDAEATGVFRGSAVDRRDGFIHFSTADQVAETAARHFAGIDDLLIVAVRADAVSLRWEPSRGGALFPHLYDPLPLTAVRWATPLRMGLDGQHEIPPLEESP